MEIDPLNHERVEDIKESSKVSGSKEASPTTDSGLSSIEKSKSVRPEVVPSMSAPILMAPSNMESVVFAVASVDSKGMPITETVRSFILQGEDIKNNILAGWMKNLREIEEYVRQLLNSPVYQQLQEIRLKGDPLSSTVSGVQGTASANAAARIDPVNFLSTLDRLQTIEHVPPTAEIPEPSAPQDASQVLVLPLTAALLSGGFVAGTELINASTHHLGGIVELIERLQPIFPQVSIQDLIPVINLMIVGPIYYNSWSEAVSNLKNREQNSYVQTAQNFAKDVIKIVTDPHFVQGTLINRMRGTNQLSLIDQDRLARMLKVVLIGVSLSLLYSVEVGKVQNGKYNGIEPEELRDILLGKLIPDSKKNEPTNLQGILTSSLIQRAQEQLAPLSMDDRFFAANMLIDYTAQARELDPMLDPIRVFDEALSSSNFNARDKINMFKA